MDDPDNPDRMLREALALGRQGRPLEAIAAYQAVLARWPALADSWYHLALLQRRVGQFPAALASYQCALDAGVERPEDLHLNRGVIWADHLHRPEEAQRELERALAINPRYVPALLNLANLHEDLGRRAPALAAYERILALDPKCLEALARYANLSTFAGPEDPLIARLRIALAEPDASHAERASLGFALGRALDACGCYDAAFLAYTQANRDSRSSAPPGTRRYERRSMERRIDALIASFAAAPPAPLADFAPPAQADSGSRAPPRPIFVCGMFRSGSTLVEQLLAGHPRVTAGGELNLLPQIAQEVFGSPPPSFSGTRPSPLPAYAARYLDTIGRLFPAAEFVTDKRPDNFLYIGLIKQLFPDAKIVHTTREPLDNCLSIYFLHLDQQLSYALDLMDIGHYYQEYRRLMAHWKATYGADILDLDYDALVREPRPATEKLLRFLGLDWDERCLTVPPSGRAIKTASVWQVREPLYRRSSGRARHYARELAGLSAYLDRQE